MKALVVTGSRADRNGLEVVHEALLKAGHESTFAVYPSQELARASRPDVIVVGGDRIEILRFVVSALDTWPGVSIAHIAGGDVTEGSADDRYRDAITALACIHFPTNMQAWKRLNGDHMTKAGYGIYLTGSPAIDRIKQTPVLSKHTTLGLFGFDWNEGGQYALVCVHPNTIGSKPYADFDAVSGALQAMPELRLIILGANADNGGAQINDAWRTFVKCHRPETAVFRENVEPLEYYSLMQWCDVMVGNSSAMLYEAPCFGLPCVLVGDRQKGRLIPSNVVRAPLDPSLIASVIRERVLLKRFAHDNPYGDGNSAPRIVKALEENAWRWKREKVEIEVAGGCCTLEFEPGWSAGTEGSDTSPGVGFLARSTSGGWKLADGRTFGSGVIGRKDAKALRDLLDEFLKQCFT